MSDIVFRQGNTIANGDGTDAGGKGTMKKLLL